MLKNVEEGMYKHKKIPLDRRSCLRPCYQDTWIMTPNSTVETLIFSFPQQGYSLVGMCVGAEPLTSRWQKLRPVSMPIVYGGIHHDSYPGVH